MVLNWPRGKGFKIWYIFWVIRNFRGLKNFLWLWYKMKKVKNTFLKKGKNFRHPLVLKGLLLKWSMLNKGVL